MNEREGSFGQDARRHLRRFGLFALGLTAAHADDAACKAVADAMLTNAKTPYHSLGIISFDPSNPASSDGSPGPSAIRTETIFTGQQVS